MICPHCGKDTRLHYHAWERYPDEVEWHCKCGETRPIQNPEGIMLCTGESFIVWNRDTAGAVPATMPFTLKSV